MITSEDITNTLNLAATILEKGSWLVTTSAKDPTSKLEDRICTMRSIAIAADEVSNLPNHVTLSVRNYLIDWLDLGDGSIAAWNDAQSFPEANKTIAAQLRIAARSLTAEGATV